MVTRKARLLGLTTMALFVALLLSLVFMARTPGLAAVPARDAKPTDEVTARVKAQVALAEKCYQYAYEGLRKTSRVGNVLVQVVREPEEAYTWSVRWLQGQRELSRKHADQIAALEAHLKRMTELAERAKELSRDLIPRSKADAAEWYRLEAQIWLARAKAKPPG